MNNARASIVATAIISPLAVLGGIATGNELRAQTDNITRFDANLGSSRGATFQLKGMSDGTVDAFVTGEGVKISNVRIVDAEQNVVLGRDRTDIGALLKDGSAQITLVARIGGRDTASPFTLAVSGDPAACLAHQFLPTVDGGLSGNARAAQDPASVVLSCGE